MTSKSTVIHLTTVHSPYDVRIFYKEARSLLEAGYDVAVAAPSIAATIEQDVRILPLGRPGGSRWRRLTRDLRAALLMLSARDAILHLHDPELLLAAYIPSLLGRRLIFDVHEFYTPHIKEATWIPYWLRGFASRAYDWLEPRLLRKFHGVVIAVDAMRERYVAIVGASRLALVRNFPYIRDDEKTRALAESHPLDGRPYILHTGGASRLRAFHTLVDVIEYVRNHECDWPVVNIGEIDLSGYSPQQTKDLLKRATAAGIKLLGTVTQEQAWRYCAHAKIGVIFLLPVENNCRGLPNKLFEYWTFGLPVFAPNMGQIAQVVQRCGAGLLFDPNDASSAGNDLLGLIRHTDLRSQLADKALQAAKFYDFKSEAASLLELYRKIELAAKDDQIEGKAVQPPNIRSSHLTGQF